MLSGGSTLRDSSYRNAMRCSHTPSAGGAGASPRGPAPGAGGARSGLISTTLPTDCSKGNP